jgi:superfamily II DNA or RNA helicase
MKTLRPYQEETIDAVHRTFEASDSAVVVWPTGMGKTVLASKLMTGWQRGNALFLAHTTELIEQAAEKLAAEMDGYKPVVEMNIRGADRYTIHQGGLIVVGSVQSMYADQRLEKYSEHPFGLIIVDECHRATASTYKKVIDYFRQRNPSLKVLGLTATPNRADGTSLGLIFESVAYQISINQSIEQGWLCPIRQESVIIQGLDFSGLRTRINELGERDFSGEALEQIISEEENLQAFAKATIDLAGDRSTLVFTPGVQSAHLLASIFNRYRDRSAEAVDGDTPKDDRPRIIDRFKRGKTQFLCNAQVLTEGFDAPNCSCVAMCRPTKSLGRYIQMLGRGLRPLPGTVDGVPEAFDRRMAIMTSAKPDCLVLDFGGNSQHKLVDVWDVLGGSYDAETKELAEREGDKKNVLEDLDKAKLLRVLMMQWQERKPIVADHVEYSKHAVDIFDGPSVVSANMPKPKRGTATEGQIGLLVKLGVSPETAASYSKTQAGAVIDKLKSTRCTVGQAKTLRTNGINPEGINMDKASKLIDALARNDWRRLSSEQVVDILGG